MNLKKIELIGVIFFSIFVLSINGISFSDLFIVSTLWIIYIDISLNKIAYRKNERWLNILCKIYRNLVIVFVISFFLIEGIIIFNINQFKEVKYIEKLDYMIVLGAGIDGYKVGETLKSRLDEALKYYELNKSVDIIVSGGQGKDEITSEAEAMYRYLVEKGVNPNQIIKEDKATTTLENIIFSKEILKNRNDEDKKVLIVTSEFHLYRSMLIANILDVKNEGLSSYTPFKIRVNYILREYPTIVIDVIKSNLYKVKTH